MKGDTSPSLCSAGTNPFSTKIKLGDDGDPDSRTIRLPVAVTFAFGFWIPISFNFPLLKVRVTVAFFVGETLITRAVGFADVEPPANDHCRA